MKKNLTPFERSLQKKMESHELPYEPAAWAGLQRHMGMAKTGSSVWIVSLVSTIIALSGGGFALYRHQHTPSSAMKASVDERFSIAIANTTRGVSHHSVNSSHQDATFAPSASKMINAAEVGLHSVAFSANAIVTQDNAVTGANMMNESVSSSAIPFGGQKPDNLIEFACNVRKACQGEEVEFQTTNGPKTGSYLWNFGDGHFSDEMNPKHKFAKAGDYDVSLSITSDNGQINTTVVNDMITIEAAPDADFTWEFVNSDPNTPEVRIINLSEGGSTYEWSNGNESTEVAEGARFALKPGGRQMIALNAKNAAGCTDGAVKHISVNSDFTLGAASQWSPKDGPYMPQGLKKSKVDFSLSIYDMTGSKIFETSSRVKGWDGKLPGGGYASEGAYSYKVIITNDLTQEQKYFNGTFNVHP
jgi:PKD repeat protein